MGFEAEAESSSNSLRRSPTEDTPLIGDQKSSSSQSKTFANVFIAIVGAGVLGLPYTFKRTGWLMGLIMLFSVAALTQYCMMLLVYTRRKIESINGFSKITSFGDLAFILCGVFGKSFVDVLIILAQAGFCVGYLIYIGNTVGDLFNSPTTADLKPKILGLVPKNFYILGCFPFQLGLNSIKTLTHLAPLSIFADVIDLGAMGVVMVEDVIVLLKRSRSLIAFGDLSIIFYGLGVAAYSFEGVGMVLPLESEIKDKAKFGKILGLTMVSISVIYGSFGALGYFAYGEETKDLITANMGPGLLSTLVKLGLCVNLFFTLPIMMNPVYEIVERRFWGGRYCIWLRWVSVLMVCLVAVLVPNFTDFVSLVGSGVCCVLGFVLPSFFHYLVFKDEMGWFGRCSDIIIIVVGIVLAVTGTWSALQQMFSE